MGKVYLQDPPALGVELVGGAVPPEAPQVAGKVAAVRPPLGSHRETHRPLSDYGNNVSFVFLARKLVEMMQTRANTTFRNVMVLKIQ